MKKQSGFAILEIIVVFVVIGVMAGTAYYVGSHRQPTKKTTNTAVTEQAAKTAASPKPKQSFAFGSVYETSLSQVPQALQSTIVDATTKDSAHCVKNGEIVDAKGNPVDKQLQYMPDGFAETSIGCRDAASTLFVFDGAEWEEVGATTSLYECRILEQYQVPMKFMEAIDSRRPVKCVEYPYDNPSIEGTEHNYKGE